MFFLLHITWVLWREWMWLILLSTHSHWFQHFGLLHFWNGLWTALSLFILAPWCSHEDIITLPSDSLIFILFSSICITLLSASLCSLFYRISDFCFLVPHQTLSPNGQGAHKQKSMVLLLSCLGERRDTFHSKGLLLGNLCSFILTMAPVVMSWR